MSKKVNLNIGVILVILGVIFTAIDRFSASADELTSFGKNFSIFIIIGLILILVGAIWLFRTISE